ncbi:hypothetical protein ACQ4PT_021807 [Festuca glaucescens]
MTVRDALGDSGGDLATPPPARAKEEGIGCGSPKRPLGGRFWVLQSSDDEDDGNVDELSADGDSASRKYLCRTPLSVSGRDLSEPSSELARRMRKRINRQTSQRLAAMEAMEIMSSEGKVPSPLLPLGMSLCKNKVKVMPVLQPSVFVDDGLDGWTVVRRRRWSPANERMLPDPFVPVFSNIDDVGSEKRRAGAKLNRARWGPKQMMRADPLAKIDADSQPKRVKVGDQVAGHAFRNLLGLAWKKIESGEAVVQPRRLSTPMNGDGRQGGGFNAGRGGYQPRGGFGAGRGANARGRQGGRGGHAIVPGQGYGSGQGYGAGQGFRGGRGGQGNGFGRNFVQGEAIRVAGRGGYQQRFHTNVYNAPARGGIDADLLQQTVQAVVAAVTAAQKPIDPVGGLASLVPSSNDIAAGAPNKNAGGSVAVANVQQQAEVPNHSALDAQEVGSRGKEAEGPGPSKKKKDDKTSCFRCKKAGHYIDDCPTPFCDLCESIHHVASACHLLHAPKPTATMHGYANEALMFFELPCGAFKAKVENPKLAKVTVDGDAMTIPEIIEQLKRIVPYEKFNWEVFHLKDNIFRVKLPSKQEVQRLKIFGTYICQDRESCLSFDIWSSLEEPLYMLPEVWVRVSGVPSDMRSDYLSLWGVGTLFGKTLDVDMVYTRKNKVLRTKIGCLDKNLIPADSDVFIRRGFFKLRFEVETVQGSQEVNMVDANNGNDGNDDAHQGQGNNGGGHAMDMDHRGHETEATSNNNEKEASNGNNGIDRMQEQLHRFDAIQIGTMNVNLNTPDSARSKLALGLGPVGFREKSPVAVSGSGHATAAAVSTEANDCSRLQHAQSSSMHHRGGQALTAAATPLADQLQQPHPVVPAGGSANHVAWAASAEQAAAWQAGSSTQVGSLSAGVAPEARSSAVRQEISLRRLLLSRHRGSGQVLDLCLRQPCMAVVLIRPSWPMRSS